MSATLLSCPVHRLFFFFDFFQEPHTKNKKGRIYNNNAATEDFAASIKFFFVLLFFEKIMGLDWKNKLTLVPQNHSFAVLFLFIIKERTVTLHIH